jgi:hypothetical protein
MTIERKVSSIESSFSMESLKFDDECRKRVKEVLTDKTTVSDAIADLNMKYRVSASRRERSRV